MPIIELQDVHKAYGQQTILQAVNLRVDKGEKIALMGASGCGKTTLLRCLNALERADRGSLRVNETDLMDEKLDLNRFRAHIGMVFQQFNLFPHLTVLENIMLAPRKVKRQSNEQAREKAMQLLQQIGIPDKAVAYPEQLSGGQKQRVAIARSLAMEPDLLLLDEPTSALDPPMRREVLNLIETVAEAGMTIVMVTHEVEFAEHMVDRLIFMDAGQIVEQGPPDQILDDPRHEATRRYLSLVL